MRGETLIFVCSNGCVVGPLKTGLYKLNGGSGRRPAVVIPASLRISVARRTLKWKKLCFS